MHLCKCNGVVDPLEIRSIPTCYAATDKEIRLENLTSRFKVTEVIRINTYRPATYDFLLKFHSNYGPTTNRFRDKRRFQSKIEIFPLPLELGNGACPRKSLISLAVWIQCTSVTGGETGRETDGHRPTDSTAHHNRMPIRRGG